MAERGEVRAVAWMQQGSELAAAASIGALSLTLNNAVDFDEDGGTVDVNGLRYEYDTIDPDSSIMTLASALSVAAAVDDRVLVVSGGNIAVDYVAFVSLGDGDEIEVPIPYGDIDLWPEGEYLSPVVVDLSDDLEEMLRVPSRTPLRDGSFLDPTTVPTDPAVLTILNGKTRSTASPTAPSSPGVGDIWIDTANGNVLKMWNGTVWTSLPDAAIAAAQLDATNALTSSNGKNKVTYSVSSPGTTANTANDLWYRTSGTTVIEQWRGNGGTSWTQVAISGLVLTNLDAGSITTGFLNAARLDARTITADKLVIGAGTNWIPNAGFEAATTAPHTTAGGGSLSLTTTTPRAGAQSLVLTIGTTRASGAYGYEVTFAAPTLTNDGRHMPVKGGEVVYGEAWVRNGTTSSGEIMLFVDQIDSAGARISNTPDSTVSAVLTSSTWTKISVTATMSGTAVFASLNLGTANVTAGQTVVIDDPWLGKKGDGSLIVDGTVRAGQIAAGAVTATAILAGAIDGMTITGPNIRTAAAGQRLDITSSAGVYSRISFYTGTVGETAPAMLDVDNTNATYANSPGVFLTSPQISGVTANSQGLIQLYSSRGGGATGIVLIGPYLLTQTTQVNGAATFNNTVDLTHTGGGRFTIGSGGGGYAMRIMAMRTEAVSVNASGIGTITHGMSTTPVYVFLQTNTVTNVIMRPITLGATTFTVEFRVLTTGALSSTTTASITWLAVA